MYGENILSCFFKTYIWRPRIFIMKYEFNSFEYHQMIIGKTYGKLHKLECLYWNFKLKTPWVFKVVVLNLDYQIIVKGFF